HRRCDQQVRFATGPARHVPGSRARERRTHHRAARASRFRHPGCGALVRRMRAACKSCRTHRQRAHPESRRRAWRTVASGRSGTRSPRRRCRACRGEARVSAIRTVAGARPLAGGRRRRAAGARHPVQAQGHAGVPRLRCGHARADPSRAVRRLARDRQPHAARSAGRHALPSGRADLRIRRRARFRPPPAAQRGRRRAADRAGRCLRRIDGLALQFAAPCRSGGHRMNTLADPRQAQVFRFVRCGYADGVAELVYAFDTGPELVERIRFPDAPKLPDSRKAAFDAALRLLHFFAGVSYYKAGLPPRIEVETGDLDNATADLLDTLYLHGLGEFAYRNGLDLRGRIAFLRGSSSAPIANALALPNRTLVPIGGGKDSLVVVEALKKAGTEATATWVGASPLIAAVAARTGLPMLNIGRELSPLLFDYNRMGAWNGHIPVTAINSAILACAAVLYGFDAIAFANERSASAATLEYEGVQVNHQWSKGWAFEKQFAAWLHTHVA